MQRYHHPMNNMGFPMNTAFMQPPIDQFKTMFSVENINYDIFENNKRLKASIDALGSHALYIKKNKAYKYYTNYINVRIATPMQHVLIFATKMKIKLYNDSFTTIQTNINNILTSPDSYKINKKNSDELKKIIKYNEAMHSASNQLLFNKDIIKCYENSKTNKIKKNSDKLCSEYIKIEDIQEKVNTIVATLGSMIIAKSEHNYTKINDYFDSISNIKKCIAYNYHNSKFYNIFNKNQLQNFYEEISFILCIANILLQKNDFKYTDDYNFNDSNSITSITRKTMKKSRSSKSSGSRKTIKTSKSSISKKSKKSKTN